MDRGKKRIKNKEFFWPLNIYTENKGFFFFLTMKYFVGDELYKILLIQSIKLTYIYIQLMQQNLHQTNGKDI
jgi:hypothetical protein